MVLSRIVTFLAIVCVASNAVTQASRHLEDREKMGNPKILETGSGLISIDKELTIGDTFAAEFDKSVRLVSDPSAVGLISRIGQNLVAHSDLSMPCHFRILDIDGMDVLAFLGGRVYVNKGIIIIAGNEAELAGAMAHAVAHVAARHTARLIDREMSLRIQVIRGIHDWHWSSLTTSVMGSSLADLEGVAEAEREFEVEADQLAVRYLWNTGYDPNAYITLLRKLMQREKELPGVRSQVLSYIPDTKDRITASEQERSQLPHKEHYILNTPEFDRIKGQLHLMDNAEKSGELPAGEEQKRPILKRRATEKSEQEAR